MLRQTKPWVRFISVLMFIGAAFVVIAGIGILISGGRMVGVQGGFGPLIGGIYFVMAILYIVPGIFLWKYADGIRNFLEEKSAGALTTALEAQKSFWRFVGIVALVILIIYGFIFLFGLAMALSG